MPLPVTCFGPRRRVGRSTSAAVFALLTTLLAGCRQEPVAQSVIRPVRVITVASGTPAAEVLAGEVRPRHEARLAFRVGGQLVRRHVDVGASVRAGEPLAEIDPRDYRLASAAAAAQVRAARTQLDLAQADLKRAQELRARNFVSEAEIDRREAVARGARAALDAAEADLARLSNQSGYAVLVAPNAGVVTAVEAETGQVLESGQAVIRLARPEEREVAVSIPEQRVGDLSAATAFTVRLAARPGRAYRGRLRELAPSADPATRTYPARIALEDADAAVRLGMSAQVEIGRPASAAPFVPVAAVFHRDGVPAVWVVDPGDSTVRLQPVRTGTLAGNLVEILQGLAPGQVVVTAGVQLLEAGRKVRLLDEAR